MADLDELVIREVCGVPFDHDLVGEGRIDLLFERERVLVVGHPVKEWVVRPAREYLINDLERELDVTVCGLVELRYLVEWVVQVARGNEDVRVEEEHSVQRAPRIERSGSTFRGFTPSTLPALV